MNLFKNSIAFKYFLASFYSNFFLFNQYEAQLLFTRRQSAKHNRSRRLENKQVGKLIISTHIYTCYKRSLCVRGREIIHSMPSGLPGDGTMKFSDHSWSQTRHYHPVNPVLEQNQPMDNEKQSKARKCFIWQVQEAVLLAVTSAGSAGRLVYSLIPCFC